ncbi:MAG: carboxynorspermidine decarboxylase [Candidatus Portnoybacteria bacterium CG_4_10_14_0_8_um_filter_40_50]|uniref:Carboxynorspermidine decarboxylase n=1 Tax=Candidatus Portnoybacteria bacterium CG_4_10_14_0_8_um_filter_40_50 TaxID=1974800 RepID=A0A2M7QTQ7_9BACT|nr:MAG: carboxynorspermidine decarboxylase [Candidatus Portnoybacteria bacterium CG_4_10_14_0_8_um_filter_40_50]
MAKKVFIEPWIDKTGWKAGDFGDIQTPCYVVDKNRLEKNLKILAKVQKDTGCKILIALKGFAMFSVFGIIRKYLCGVAASSLNETRLGFEEFKKEVHVFSPAYTEKDFAGIMRYADHIVFNSFSQWKKYRRRVLHKKISCGIRVNPEHSEVKISFYDPCGSLSRLGVTMENFEPKNLKGIEGLHFHCLCENNADALGRTLKVFEKKFGEFLPQMKWVNFGGGHHITRKNYDIKLLCQIIKDFKKRYPHLQIYLEPGEAIALNAGVLVARVIDIFKNKMNIAILDVSAACHMPDVLEMPYWPQILGAGKRNQYPYVYRLGGPSCLAGDIIGDYSSPKPLTIGSKLIFFNMAIYTMVKNTTFNGMQLPSIALRDKMGKIKVIKKFGYKDFKNRLS